MSEMLGNVLACWLVAALLASADAASVSALRAQLTASRAACINGSNGIILRLNNSAEDEADLAPGGGRGEAPRAAALARRQNRLAEFVVRQNVNVGRQNVVVKKTFVDLLPAVTMDAPSDDFLDDLLNDPEIERVEADCRVVVDISVQQTAAADHSRRLAQQTDMPWNLDMIDAPAGEDGSYSWSPGAAGEGIRIYVLDTGVRTDHEDFAGRAVGGWSTCNGFSVACSTDGSTGWVDQGIINGASGSCNSHGTHVASTAAGARYGVAKGATVVAVQVLSCLDGSGSFSAIFAAMEWAASDSNGQPAVISMSLGAQAQSTIMHETIALLHRSRNMNVVVAAGNSNMNAIDFLPASTPDAITVGAVDRSGKLMRTSQQACSHGMHRFADFSSTEWRIPHV